MEQIFYFMDNRLMNPVYLLCGVPASGKTWVSNQLKDKFFHIPHDFYSFETLVELAAAESTRCGMPILMDCPFNERKLRAALEFRGLRVYPIFIIESPDVIKERYLKREGRYPPQNVMTRADTIQEKVVEWDAPHGTSQEILEHLKSIGAKWIGL